MRRIAKVAGWSCFALAMLALAGWACSRMLGPSAQEREALALLERPWHPAGSNAFDAIWLLHYDVPEAALAALVDADATWIRAQPPQLGREPGEGGSFVHSAEGRHASLALSTEDADRLCRPRADDCLAKVRAEIASYRELVARNARLLGRIQALSRYGHVRNRLPPSVDAPLPALTTLGLGVTADALRFAEGDVEGALASTCTAISTWRRLGAATDVLIIQMIAIAYAGDGHARLLADMLRELPRDQAVPQACRAALAPAPAQEASICQSIRGEFAMFANSMRTLETTKAPTDSPLGNALLPMILDAEATILDAAPHYAHWCGPQVEARLARDESFRAQPAASEDDVLRLECLANPAGCVLAAIARPDVSPYQNRALDQSVRLRLLATALWLHENRSTIGPVATRLAARPQLLRGPGRDVQVGTRGDTLRIRQYDTSGGRADYWEIALSPDVVDSAPGDATPER